MGLVRLVYNAWQQVQRRADFERLCLANDIALELSENIADLTILKEIFEARVYADYFPFYQKATVLDIGAHKGYFSLFALKNLDPQSRIIAVEPYASHVEILKKNLILNDGVQVQVLAAGLSDRSGQAQLHIAQSENHSLFPKHSSLLKRQRPFESVTVQVYALKDLLAELQLERVDFLKMDCEGAEYPALLAADAETLSKIGAISLEFHDLKDARYTGLELAKFLSGHGFTIAKLQHAATTINNNFGYLMALRS